MALLTAEQILKSSDLPTEDIDVPEWGGTVRIRVLNGHERNAFENMLERVDGRLNRDDNLRVKLSAMSMVGEDGKQLFTVAQVTALAGKSAIALDRVYAAALRLNGMSKEGREDVRKNSDEEPGAGSSST